MIEEHENKVNCAYCFCDLHTHCHTAHNPCPQGWLAKEIAEESIAKDLAPELSKVGDDDGLATSKSDVQSMVKRIEKLESGRPRLSTPEQPRTQQSDASKASGYPSSPHRANIGNSIVATKGHGHTGFALQYSKPREADSVKLLKFPTPGTGFEKWWDHALGSISASTPFCTEAYQWTLEIEKSETNFATLGDSGSLMRLDALLLAALMECIPGDTHLLRQQIKKAKMEQRQQHQRNITGRQVLWMTYKYFAMNEKDRDMTDTARLHKVILTNGDLQKFIHRWDELLAIMRKRPSDV